VSAAADTVTLTCHPSTHCPAVRRLAVRIAPLGSGTLRLTYSLQADLAGLRLPPRLAAPARTDELWRHTCFEAFIAAAGQSGYTELNFSPSGEWASYAFSGYRAGMAQEAAQSAPVTRLETAARGFELEVSVAAIALAREAPARLALAAVIEEAGGLCYWALRHAPGKPDFHHPEGFALEI